MFTGVSADPGRPATALTGAGVDGQFAFRLNRELLRRPGRLVVACLTTVLGPAVVAQAGSISTQPSATNVRTVADPAPDVVPGPVPGNRASWLPLAQRAAATCPGLSSAVLVAIGSVESSLGLQTGASSAGALGPMQFLPATWAAYGVDGDSDGVSDVMNPVDAVHGAAHLLCANGGADPERLPSALWNYNHSDDYVSQIISLSHLTPAG